MRAVPASLLSLTIAGCFATALFSPAWSQSVLHAGVASDGKVIAMTWCSACHLVAPAASGQKVAADVPTFVSIAQGLPTDADVLSAFIANPHPPMPNLGLSQQDVRDLLAYIATLR